MTAEAWTMEPLAAVPGVRRLTLGEREALFCERRQQLFELDAAGAAIWDGLAAGRAAPAVAEALAIEGLAPAARKALCLARAREWSEAGWFTPRTLVERLAAAPSHLLALRLGALDARLELRLEEPSLWAHARDAFGHFARADDASACDLKLDLVTLGPRHFLMRDGAPVALLPAERVMPEIKALLTEALCGRPMRGGLWLHAALLSRGERGLLLAGAPGAGKTTLAVALATRGFGYATDDLVQASADGALRGVRFSPALKAGAWPLLAPHAPSLGDLPIHLRGDGQQVRYLPAGRLPPYRDAAPSFALLLERRDGAPARLEALDPLNALTELLSSAYAAERRLAGDTLAALAGRFARIDCRRLVYSDLADAADCIVRWTDG
jgi:hypothetical protein